MEFGLNISRRTVFVVVVVAAAVAVAVAVAVVKLYFKNVNLIIFAKSVLFILIGMCKNGVIAGFYYFYKIW